MLKFSKFDYEYKTQSTQFMAEAQLAWQFDLNKVKLMPFVLVGIGPSLNSVNSYKEKLVNPNASIEPRFDSKTEVSFAYQLGGGVAFPFHFDRDRLFLSYRYIDSGKAHFNSRSGYPLYQLDVGRIKANEFYIGYTHLFEV